MAETETRWRSRITGHGEADPSTLVGSPYNWRTHPERQQHALAQALDSVGWVQSVIVNRETGHVVDGHLRVALALARSEPSIPVDYVELSVDEERLVLATLDPLSTLAVPDDSALQALLSSIDVEGDLAWLLGEDAPTPPAPTQDEIDEQAQRLNRQFDGAGPKMIDLTCPTCGHEFAINPSEYNDLAG